MSKSDLFQTQLDLQMSEALRLSAFHDLVLDTVAAVAGLTVERFHDEVLITDGVYPGQAQAAWTAVQTITEAAHALFSATQTGGQANAART